MFKLEEPGRTGRVGQVLFALFWSMAGANVIAKYVVGDLLNAPEWARFATWAILIPCFLALFLLDVEDEPERVNPNDSTMGSLEVTVSESATRVWPAD